MNNTYLEHFYTNFFKFKNFIINNNIIQYNDKIRIVYLRFGLINNKNYLSYNNIGLLNSIKYSLICPK